MIDEKKLIEAIMRDVIITTEEAFDLRNEIVELIKEQPQADKWIPVEVEMPPKPRFREKGYLVQIKNVVEPYLAYWNGKEWIDESNDIVEDVLAWQPLPQPYKKEGCLE